MSDDYDTVDIAVLERIERKHEEEIAALKADLMNRGAELDAALAAIGALKAERDRLGSYNSHLIADREILFAENIRLRAALEAVLPIAEAFRGRVDMEPKLQIARHALDERSKR
jgi:hypothetical protein